MVSMGDLDQECIRILEAIWLIRVLNSEGIRILDRSLLHGIRNLHLVYGLYQKSISKEIDVLS